MITPEYEQFKTLYFEYCRNERIAVPLHPEFLSHLELIFRMNATIVIYGSSTGTCEAIAEKIAQKLGCEAINVQDLTAEVVDNNQNLILGTSTWGAGELQDDWYDGLKVLQVANLAV